MPLATLAVWRFYSSSSSLVSAFRGQLFSPALYASSAGWALPAPFCLQYIFAKNIIHPIKNLSLYMQRKSAIVVGAGMVGLAMAEALPGAITV